MEYLENESQLIYLRFDVYNVHDKNVSERCHNFNPLVPAISEITRQ